MEAWWVMPKSPRRLSRAPQEVRLFPDPSRERQKELRRQFADLVEMEDEDGYWAWLSLQPEFDGESADARKLAQSAWKEALAARRSTRRLR